MKMTDTGGPSLQGERQGVAATLAGWGLSTKVTEILWLRGGVSPLPGLVAMVREPCRHSHCVILPSWQVTASLASWHKQPEVVARALGQDTEVLGLAPVPQIWPEHTTSVGLISSICN